MACGFVSNKAITVMVVLLLQVVPTATAIWASEACACCVASVVCAREGQPFYASGARLQTGMMFKTGLRHMAHAFGVTNRDDYAMMASWRVT
jgi:hypothetical protein